MECMSLCLQAKYNRLSQISNFIYNSMAIINGSLIGVDNNGMYTLDNGDLDGTELIAAEITLASTDFGIPNYKKIRKIYVGFYSDSDLTVTFSCDKILPCTEVISVASAGYNRGYVVIPNNMIGKYWTIKISNTNGGYFSIDSIDVLLITLTPSMVL